MPTSAAGCLLCLVLFAQAVSASPTGSKACLQAARQSDVSGLHRACAPGREAGNLVDGFNLAVGLREVDPAAARAHLRWAAEGGLAEAAHLYGNLLLDEGDTETGLAWLQTAAAAGLAVAHYDYATALLEVQASGKREAILYAYAAAAAGGEQAARYNLGVLHLEGHLGTSDPVLAWAWFTSMASLDGHVELQRLVNRLTREMSAADRRRAIELRDVLRNDPLAAFAPE